MGGKAIKKRKRRKLSFRVIKKTRTLTKSKDPGKKAGFGFSGIIRRMGPVIKILLALNDYLYDLAIFTYAAGGFLSFLMRRSPKAGALGRLAKYSMVLFILAGIPRMLLYHSSEWGDWGRAVGAGRTGELLAHIIFLGVLAGLGTLAWIKSKSAEAAVAPASEAE